MDQPGPRQGRRPGRSWVRVSYGLYRPDAAPDGTLADLAAWQMLMTRSASFTHLTGAALYGWWLPTGLPDLPVFVAQCADDPRPRRRGLQICRLTAAPPWRELRGLRVSEPAEVLLACARDLALADLVVLCDSALRLGDVDEDAIAVVAASGRRGSPALRRALALADGRSESAWESLLRLLHVTGEVPVEPQYVVVDSFGDFVARGDLWIVGSRTLHEYDGAVHRDGGQHRKDLERDRRLATAGWTRRGFTSVDVLTRAAAILREADQALGRTHRSDRVRAWHALLAESLFTPSGRARLRRRWAGRRVCSAA